MDLRKGFNDGDAPPHPVSPRVRRSDAHRPADGEVINQEIYVREHFGDHPDVARQAMLVRASAERQARLSVAEKGAATGALWTQLDAALVANAKPMALVVALGVLSRPSETGS